MANQPRYVTALVSALSFRRAQPELLQRLDDSEWEQLLVFGDQMHLTIPLAQVYGKCPLWVQSRIDRNIVDNSRRFQTLKATYAEIADALREARVEHVILKGFTKSPDYAPDPRHRMQSDIDLFCPLETIFRARDALSAIGYKAQHGFDDMPWDHLPTLRRKTDWEWRGNAYDPDMPLTVELHHSFWDRAAARCGPQSLSSFWQRRVVRRLEEMTFSALGPIDSLGYAALNLLRDLLRVGIVTSQVYELAWFLHHHSRNDNFWTRWVQMHDDELRRIESVSFLLATTWFHCDLAEAAQAEVRRLPLGTRRWFENPATAPSPMGWLRPSKDAVWLHSSLMDSGADKRRVVFGRLFPRAVLPVDTAMALRTPNIFPDEQSVTHNYTRYLVYLFARIIYHLKIVPRTLWHGCCWRWSARTSNRALL
jgi:hypothetical protein